MKINQKNSLIAVMLAALCAACVMSGCFRTEEPPESSDTGDTSVNGTSLPGRLVSDFGTESSQEAESETTIPTEESQQSYEEQSVQPSELVSDGESSTQSSEQSVEESSQESEESERPADSSDIDGLDKKYFVKKLSPKLLSAFAQLYRAAKEFKPNVEFEKPINDDDLTTLMFLLNYDCPELIQLNGDFYPEYIDTTRMLVGSVGLSLNINEDEYRKQMSRLDKYFTELKQDTAGMSELEIEKYVYDAIFSSCIYNEYDKFSGSAYGVLIGNCGRCEGYSKAFLWCMRELGIECMSVSGSQNWDSNARYSEHSWNIVRIDGHFYHLDITVDNVQLDNRKSNPANYGFFNVTDDDVSDNRVIRNVYTDLGIPVCDCEDLNYHKMNDLYVYKEKSLKDSIYNAMEKYLDDDGFPPFSLKYESEAAYRDMLENADEIIKQFFLENSVYDYDYTKITNDLSRTLILKATRKDQKEED